MEKVFLTGATGFVGAYLAHYLLKKGYSIKALHRPHSAFHLVADIQNKIEWVEGDITDPYFLEEAMKDCTLVYHAAALVSYNSADNEQMLKINAEGTANMINAALHVGIRKFLYVSSIAALGRKEFVSIFDENSVWENNKLNTGYAISKFKGECEVWRGIEEGLEAIIINPAVILGAGYWHQGTGNYFTQVQKGMPFYPKGSTAFVDVRDVAKVAIKLMESNLSAERFVLCSENTSYLTLFTKIAEELNAEVPRWTLPSWSEGLLWRADAIKAKILGNKPLITPEILQNMQNSFTYSNEKLLKAINYTFVPFSKTIADTAVAYMESKRNNTIFGLLPLENIVNI